MVVKRAAGKRAYRQKRRQKKAALAAAQLQAKLNMHLWDGISQPPIASHTNTTRQVAVIHDNFNEYTSGSIESPVEACFGEEHLVPEGDSSCSFIQATSVTEDECSLDSNYLESMGLVVTRDAMPDHLMKYWRHRYSLFSRFDEGVVMDQESWYSVTPEKVAQHIAQRCPADAVVVDAFCGAGGNTIQFASRCKKVIAIDIDPIKIACAKHNAYIYGVQDKIEFIQADFMQIISSLDSVDVIFLSPPWGGPEYVHHATFDINVMNPNGMDLFKACRAKTPNIIYYLPRNTDTEQLVQLADEGSTIEIESTHLNDRLKCITAFYGSTAVLNPQECI